MVQRPCAASCKPSDVLEAGGNLHLYIPIDKLPLEAICDGYAQEVEAEPGALAVSWHRAMRLPTTSSLGALKPGMPRRNR